VRSIARSSAACSATAIDVAPLPARVCSRLK